VSRVPTLLCVCVPPPPPPLADSDGDGCITLLDFVPLYKSVAAVRRAFKRQDHHNNGQIDRCAEGWAQQSCVWSSRLATGTVNTLWPAALPEPSATCAPVLLQV
jgi:hypothetical protein